MKPIIFESLFRLMGGRRSKDRNEPSFKRSDSFKRISIKKNYLERGNKGRNPLSSKRKALPKAPPVIEEEISVVKPKEIVLTKCNKSSTNHSYNSTNNTNTTDSTKSDPPVIDYGQWIKSITEDCKEKEKQLKAEQAQKSRKQSVEDLTRTDSAISISLGRIWMDAPLAPRSLELPRPSSSSVELHPNGRRAHHSLESALKERCHTKPVERIVNKDLSCSKDSGFSLSISIPRLSEVKPVGIFRKNVYMRDRENRRFLCNANSASNKKRYSSDLYQVVVGRTPRSLKSLKLDPMIFVPPEKRKTIFTNTNTVKRRLAVQEIRDYSCPKDFQLIPDGDNEMKPKLENEDESDEDLYESISELSSSYKSSDDEDYVRRKAVKRKKSQRRNLKVLAKPNIHRAPSTLIKNRRLLKKPGESLLPSYSTIQYTLFIISAETLTSISLLLLI
uniref:Uncharacterized protein n=1 Tax=Cacopsylla melanoneura TaxID=428564 RepID=A0A8D8TJ41_9HEMI